jgi:hypothetical protein
VLALTSIAFVCAITALATQWAFQDITLFSKSETSGGVHFTVSEVSTSSLGLFTPSSEQICRTLSIGSDAPVVECKTVERDYGVCDMCTVNAIMPDGVNCSIGKCRLPDCDAFADPPRTNCEAVEHLCTPHEALRSVPDGLPASKVYPIMCDAAGGRRVAGGSAVFIFLSLVARYMSFMASSPALHRCPALSRLVTPCAVLPWWPRHVCRRTPSG